MSRIRGKNTRPELIVRKFLFAQGFRYSLHSKHLPGKPDIVLTKYKTIVDVRGCFWHGHTNCPFGDAVKTESQIITERVRTAIERDKINTAKWLKLGWKVIVVWDSCELETKKKESSKRQNVLADLVKKLRRESDTRN